MVTLQQYKPSSIVQVLMQCGLNHTAGVYTNVCVRFYAQTENIMCTILFSVKLIDYLEKGPNAENRQKGKSTEITSHELCMCTTLSTIQ